jgi:fructose-1,6-bisphosphatase/inositol monophosphatase family enzyme
LHSWDIAAAELIAIEAGARSGDFHGGISSPAEIMIASPKIFEALSDLVCEGN